MTTVETVGVRCRPWMRANDFGMALYEAIDSVVRAVGRIVVWVEAAAELSTIRISRWESTLPNPEVPKTEPPSTFSTSPTFAGFPSPMPWVPTPAYDWTESTTRA